MNRMFRVATRSLALGLISILSLVIVVISQGIPPETLVAFRDLHNDLRHSASATSHVATDNPPEVYARAESQSRLDVGTGIRAALGEPPRPKIKATRLPDRAHPSLPSSASLVESADSTSAPAMTTEITDAAEEDAGPAFELPPPPDDHSETALEVAEVAAEKLKRMPKPANEPAVEQPKAETLPPPPVIDPQVTSQLAAMQEQLNRIVTAQEQSQASQQSWLESHQLLHQRKLDQKLERIAEGLKELKSLSDQLSSSLKAVDSATVPRGYIVRQDKISTSPPGLENHPAVVRDMLQSLGDKSNLNLSLSINVEGDVAMSLPGAAPAETSKTQPNPPGYVLEKDGQKIHIPPAPPQTYQRDEFLRPIIKNPAP